MREAAFKLIRTHDLSALTALATREKPDPLLALAQLWTKQEEDIRLRMIAEDFTRVRQQQAVPELAAIAKAAKVNAARTRVTTNEEYKEKDVQLYVQRTFQLLDLSMPDGSPTSEGLQAEITAQINSRYGGVLGKITFMAYLTISPIDPNVRDGRDYVKAKMNALAQVAIDRYVGRLNQFLTLAQTNGQNSDIARHACMWIVRTGGEKFPAGIREAVVMMAATVLVRMIDGVHGAQSRLRIETLLEDNDTHPLARLIFLSGLRRIRDRYPGVHDARYCQILENVFANLHSKRPDADTKAGRWHYALLGEIMHDLSMECRLRSPFFLSRLQELRRSESVPTDIRRYAIRCQGELLRWTVVEQEHLRQEIRSGTARGAVPANPCGNTPAARAAYLVKVADDAVLSARVSSIFQSVHGMPFVGNDPRLTHFMGILANPGPDNLREQMAVCRALFAQQASLGDALAQRQLQVCQRQAIIFLTGTAEFGALKVPDPRAQTPYLELEARAILDDFLLSASNPGAAERARRAGIIDSCEKSARNMRAGVNELVVHQREFVSSPLSDRLSLPETRRLDFLRQTCVSKGTVLGPETARVLLLVLMERDGNKCVAWVPSRFPDEQARDNLLKQILQDTTMDKRVALTAALHVILQSDSYQKDTRRQALAALNRIAASADPPGGVPLWLKEARAHKAQILRRRGDDADRRYIESLRK